MKTSYRPCFEMLESRLTPSAAVQQVGHVLKITGTSLSDHVWINDDGNRVSVFVEGKLKGTFSSINKIQLKMGNGNDKVTYNVLANQTMLRDVVCDLGNGNDSFTALVVNKFTKPNNMPLNLMNLGSLGAQSTLHIAVAGGVGNDSAFFANQGIGASADLQFHFNGGIGSNSYEALVERMDINASADLLFNGGDGRDFGVVGISDMAPGSAVNETMLGGAGNDILITSLSGVLSGDLSSYVDGGEGRDQISSEFTLKNNSNGQLFTHVSGATGDDNLGIGLKIEISKDTPADPVTISADLNGGSGTDKGSATKGVSVSGIEMFSLLP